MIVKKCDICGAVMRMTTPRYKVTFDGWIYNVQQYAISLLVDELELGDDVGDAVGEAVVRDG